MLLHALDTVDALVDVCGDFLSSKVSEDLWPLLKVSRGFGCCSKRYSYRGQKTCPKFSVKRMRVKRGTTLSQFFFYGHAVRDDGERAPLEYIVFFVLCYVFPYVRFLSRAFCFVFFPGDVTLSSLSHECGTRLWDIARFLLLLLLLL